MRASVQIVGGSFFGGEIEPGTFHHNLATQDASMNFANTSEAGQVPISEPINAIGGRDPFYPWIHKEVSARS